MPFTEFDLTRLTQLSDLLADSPNVDGVLAEALRLVVEMSGRAGGALILWPENGGAPHAVGYHLPPEWETQLAEADSALVRAARAPASEPQAALSLAGCLSLNSTHEPALGALVLHGSRCSAEELERLRYPVTWLGRALRLSRLATANQRRHQELAALNEIAATLTSTLQLEDILTETIEGIRRILNVAAAALLVLDEARGELIFKKTLTGEPDWIFQYSLKVGEGLVGECVQSGQVVCVNNAQADPRWRAAIDGVTGFETRSVLCAPLLTHGQTLGAIEVFNKADGDFDAHDINLLVALTASVAHALYNARLFHQLTVANADLEASRWEMLRSRSTLQALFDGLPAPIYIVDRDYNLVALNTAGARVARSAEGDLSAEAMAHLLGRRCHLALFNRAEPCPGCRVADTFYSGHGTHRAERRWEADGQAAEWEISTYPIRDESSQTVQAIVFGQDVTEKRRLENSLAQSEKLAAMGQLAAGVAHEINNPLSAIIANTQLLQRELPPEDDRQESVDLIARAGERALRVVRNLLDFARQDKYELTPTDINSTLDNALALVQHQLATHSINLLTDLAADLPRVEASRDHLQGVWLNLLLNGRDALNGQAGEIRVTSSRVGHEIHVTVADTGMGIPPEKLPRIFEPFYTTKEPGRGTGLGLAMCHRIVKQHGGHIRVDSRVGQGTLFTVVLPLHPSAV